MLNIDLATPAAKIAEPSLSRNDTGQNKQVWLKALEEAGLRNALRSARPFISGRASSTLPETGDQSSLSEQQSSSRHLDDGAFFSAKSEMGEARAEEFHSITDTPCVKGHQGASTDWHGFNVPAQPAQAAAGSNLPAQQLDAEAMRSAMVSTALPKSWQARNVAILPSGEGVEVWIRDSAMTAPEVAHLLAGLRNSMASLGASLIRVSLNGKPVYSPARTSSGKHKFKEE